MGPPARERKTWTPTNQTYPTATLSATLSVQTKPMKSMMKLTLTGRRAGGPIGPMLLVGAGVSFLKQFLALDERFNLR